MSANVCRASLSPSVSNLSEGTNSNSYNSSGVCYCGAFGFSDFSGRGSGSDSFSSSDSFDACDRSDYDCS